ncbi:DUF2796 domain-containing protein [Alteromonas sp. NFXS44]|uniref:ZrgA family zinc uptake protein n=1 Tax=Alteromonas sp. NFXS44 TaxID=2818435 RepID=UPI0032DEF9AC
MALSSVRIFMAATSAAVLLCLVPFSAARALAGKHVHGNGQLLVAQDESNWQLQFSIPAVDLPGFGHAPESDEQMQQVHQIEKQISEYSNVFSVDGNCQLVSQEIDFPHHDSPEHDVGHETHGSQHEDELHHDGEHHDEDHHDAHHHEDVTLAYQLSCGDNISEMTITLFRLAPSLSAIEVQWINNKGQGMTDATPQSATVSW